MFAVGEGLVGSRCSGEEDAWLLTLVHVTYVEVWISLVFLRTPLMSCKIDIFLCILIHHNASRVDSRIHLPLKFPTL